MRTTTQAEGISATLVLEPQQLVNLADKLYNLIQKVCDVSSLEDSLADYLDLYPHHLSDLPQGMYLLQH